MEVANVEKSVARLAPYSVEVLEHPEPREAIPLIKVHCDAVGGQDVECDCLYFVSGLDVLDQSVQETSCQPVLPERATRPAIGDGMSQLAERMDGGVGCRVGGVREGKGERGKGKGGIKPEFVPNAECADIRDHVTRGGRLENRILKLVAQVNLSIGGHAYDSRQLADMASFMLLSIHLCYSLSRSSRLRLGLREARQEESNKHHHHHNHHHHHHHHWCSRSKERA
jgi:hypothetical protein